MAKIVEEIILKTVIDDSKSNSSLKRFNTNVKQSTENTKLFNKALKLIGGVSVIAGLKRLASAGLDVALQFDTINRALKATLGSADAAADELAFLRDVTDTLGLNLLTTAKSYSKFLAATRGTAIEGEATREIFLGISEAASALGLSAPDAEGALRAIQQIASKGRVSLEELTGQLGERLPGAVKLAAEALGLTRQELFKSIEAGEIMAEDLLPKLGKALRGEFGEAAKEAAGDSAQAQVNRLKNEWNDFLNKIGAALSVFIPVVTKFVGRLNGVSDRVAVIVNEFDKWLDEITGVTAGVDKLQGKFRDAKWLKAPEEAAEATETLADEIKRLSADLKFFDELAAKGTMAVELKFIQDELGLTDKGFAKVAGTVTKFLKEGKRIGFIVDDLKKFKESGNSIFGEGDIKDLGKDLMSIFAPLDELSSKIDKNINGIFDRIIEKGEKFKESLSLARELGLTRKEFESIQDVLQQSLAGGLSFEQIKKGVDELRREGFFGKGKEGDEFVGATAGTQIKAGTAEGTAFLQGRKLAIDNANNNKRSADTLETMLQEMRENGTQVFLGGL